MMKMTERGNGKNYTTPFLLITILFFMWGFAHSMLDVLNKHFQETLHISMTQSALVQNAVYGGYFLMAIPAGKLIMRKGYRAGVLTGLLLFGGGALLFVPAAWLQLNALTTFYLFVLALFIIGCGLTCLETSANPYATVLGDDSYAEQRINFAQSFNGLGWIFGPLIGLFLFREGATKNDVVLPYALIGGMALVMAWVFSRVQLPEVAETEEEKAQDNTPLRKHKNFIFGIIALMLYVAAQTGINSFFINFATSENVGISAEQATLWLAFGAMTLFMLGRLLGSWLMSFMRPERLLALCAVGATVCMIVLQWNSDIRILLSCYFFESIMFPTIFSLSIRGLGNNKKRAGSYLIMSIVGGAIAPTLMALIAEESGYMGLAFTIPAFCFIVILVYAMIYRHLLKRNV